MQVEDVEKLIRNDELGSALLSLLVQKQTTFFERKYGRFGVISKILAGWQWIDHCPVDTDDKRWVAGLLARKKGFGL